MGFRRKLYFIKNIYNHQISDVFFMQAMKKNVKYHQDHCKEYADILKRMNFKIEEVKTMEDVAKIPPLPTMYFKKLYLSSMSKKRMLIKATSSGTSGSQSQIGFNTLGLLYATRMALKMASYHNLLSFRRVNYIILGYEPHKSNKTVITKTQFASTLFAIPRKRAYALKYRENGYEVDFEGMKEVLHSYSKMKSPVRLIGFPSYMLFLLQELKKNQIAYKLPKNSMILLGGGWKGFYKEKVEKEELYQLVEEVLGIKNENCREFFGAVEHPTLYCSCPNHHFHVPNYSRVIVRDVNTLKPVSYGQIGLVNLLTPLADSMPLSSVMSDDLGVLHEGKTCGCGITTPYLKIIGRVGMKEIQTCAISASELLKEIS